MADALVPNQTYYYQIRVKDADGNTSEWSASSHWTQGGIPLDGEKRYIRIKYRDANGTESAWSAWDKTPDSLNNFFITANEITGAPFITLSSTGTIVKVGSISGTPSLSLSCNGTIIKTAGGGGTVGLSAAGTAHIVRQVSGIPSLSLSCNGLVSNFVPLDMNSKKYYVRIKYHDANEKESEWSAWNQSPDSNNNFFVTHTGPAHEGFGASSIKMLVNGAAYIIRSVSGAPTISLSAIGKIKSSDVSVLNMRIPNPLNPNEVRRAFQVLDLIYLKKDGSNIAQNVDLDEYNLSAGSVVCNERMELNSTTGAFIPSRLTTAQRNALTAKNGMFIYNITTAQFEGYKNGSWTAF